MLEDISPEDELIEDGFGTASSPWCSNCGQRTMYVCRPGDIRCCNCYDNSPDMLKDGSLEGESGDGITAGGRTSDYFHIGSPE